MLCAALPPLQQEFPSVFLFDYQSFKTEMLFKC